MFANLTIKKLFRYCSLLFLLSFIFGCSEKIDPITANVIAPVSFNEDNAEEYDPSYIPPVQIYFDAGNVSPANIDLIDAEIKSGVSITPKLEGQWRWSGQYALYFTPKYEWPSGTEYTVKLEPSLFNKTIAGTKTRVYKFATPPLTVSTVSADISRAPDERRTPRFTAALQFSHTMDIDAFKQFSKLTLDNQDVPFTLEYDNNTKIISIKSEPVTIQDKERKFVFEASGFSSIGSNYKYVDKFRASALVPSLGDFFVVESIDAQIVKNEKNEPQQVVMVKLSAEADRANITKSLEITLLPKYILSDGTPSDTLQKGEEDNSHNWTYEDLETYGVKGKKLPVVSAPSEGLPEIVHPFLIDIDDNKTRYAVVTIRSGIVAKDGFPMTKGLSQIITIPKYPKELYIMSDGAILPLKNNNIITFASRGVKTVNTEVGKVLNYQLQNVINSTYSGGLFYPDFADRFDESNFTTISKGKATIPYKSNKDISYSYMNLQDYTKGTDAGLYFISISGGSETVKRLILVTDMGMILKHNSNGSSSIFVMSISQGKPVSGAKIEVIGKNGLPVHSGISDENGHFSYPNLNSLARDKYPIAVTATLDNDLSFIPLNKYARSVNYSNFDVGGAYGENRAEGLKAYIFTDRGIYRPGEIAQVSGIVKQSDWQNLEGIAVEAVITDPNEKNMFVKRFTLTKEGLFEFGFKTENTMLTGYYSAELYMLKDDARKSRGMMIGRVDFRLDEFEADTMKVKARINGKAVLGWQKPELVSGIVRAENMFGTPAQGRTVKWGLNIAPVQFSFNDYAGYNFTDPDGDKEGKIVKSFTAEIPDSITDKNGEASANFKLASFTAGTYRLAMTGIVFEAGSGDGVLSYDSAIISPLDFIVGYKASGNLNFLNRGAEQKVNFIALNNNVKQIGADNLKIRLLNVKYVASLVKDVSGGYSYQSVKKFDLINESDFSIPAEGIEYNLPTGEAGRYIIEIADAKGNILSRVPYFISGAANISGGIDKNAELTIELNKKQYSPGEEISINIIAPYTGAGLITVEQDKVYSYKWFKTETTSSVQTINVPAGLEGNGYINISFIRGYDSKEIFINPHSYAVVPFSVDLDKRKINLSVSAQSLVQPGENLTINYRTDKDSKVIIFGVDEGILQVANYKAPNPLGYFFQKRALEVGTYQTVDLVLPDYRILMQAMAPGGGEAALAAGLNPFSRQILNPAIFWSGIIDAKAGVNNEFTYNVPDYFNGTLKIMAVAAASDSVGSAQYSTVSRSPVVIIPNAPFAAVAGDIFDIPVGVTNSIEGSGEGANIKITAEVSENLEIVGDKNIDVAIPEGSERTIYFKVKALDKPGAADIWFKAENGQLKKPISMSASLSVRPATLFVSKLTTGSFSGKTNEISGIFRNMYDNYAKRTVSASSNPLVAAMGVKDYLSAYPHLCTEQITSKVFPLIYLAALKGNATFNYDETSKLLKNTIDILRPRQFDDGSFALWPDRQALSVYSSVYVLHMLTDAKANGFTVPQDVMKKGLNWLSNFASSEPESLWDARTQAYAVYVLARNGVVVTRHIGRLEEYLESVYPKEWKADITSAYLGASYILMKENGKGATYMSYYKPEGEKYIFYSDYDSSSVRNATYLYLLANHEPNLLPKFRDLINGIVKNMSEGNYNTISASSFIIALGAVGQSDTVSEDGVKIISMNKGNDKTSLDITNTTFPSASFKNDTSKISIEFMENAKNGYYFYAFQEGFDKVPASPASNGLELTREYLGKDGKKITEAKLGDEVTVRIRLRASSENTFHTVAVTDLLPGGFDIVRGSVLSENIEYFDIREDRALFYILVTGTATDITYKARLVSSGEFTIPPVYGEAMYDGRINANSGAGKLKVVGNKAE